MHLIDIFLAARNALQHLSRMRERPAQAGAQILANPGEARIRFIRRQWMSDHKPAAVQTGDESVRALRPHNGIAVIARDDDEVGRCDCRFDDVWRSLDELDAKICALLRALRCQ
jgi:hypothetical protein